MPETNIDKLSEAFLKYMPEGTKFILLIVEKIEADKLKLTTLATIADRGARIEILEEALKRERKKP